MREAIKKSGILAFGCRSPAALDCVAEPVAAALAALPDVVRDEGLNVRVPFPLYPASPIESALPSRLTALLRRHRLTRLLGQ